MHAHMRVAHTHTHTRTHERGLACTGAAARERDWKAPLALTHGICMHDYCAGEGLEGPSGSHTWDSHARLLRTCARAAANLYCIIVAFSTIITPHEFGQFHAPDSTRVCLIPHLRLNTILASLLCNLGCHEEGVGVGNTFRDFLKLPGHT
eukprot:365510-Chlamydomonas_euryale.AAC.11